MSPNPAASTLRSWLDQAQSQHADQPASVATGLTERAATLPADADGAEALRLAEHVWLAHLADAAGLQAFVDRLPDTLRQAHDTAPGVQRAVWALAQLAGCEAPAPADAPRWRALQNVLLALAGSGRAEAASAMLAADGAQAIARGATEAGKAFAATAHNVAMELQCGPRGDAARDRLMLQAAALSRRVWMTAGSWLEVERADYRLSLCHAVLGQGEAALHAARQCLAGCEAAGADALERFFAHEALVRAHRAAGDGIAAAAARQQMHTLLPQISDADGLRDWCATVLRDLPD